MEKYQEAIEGYQKILATKELDLAAKTHFNIGNTFFKENRLVIRLRNPEAQNQNFVNATMIYISNVILPRIKRYLSHSLKSSIDLFIGKGIFESEISDIGEIF